MTALPQTLGLLRSLVTYYGMLPLRARRLLRFYAHFIQPGDLVFDLGAHVGNRVWVFRRLGARVVAVEPQPIFAALLRSCYPDVTVVEAGVGASEGQARLLVSRRTPTVTTLSEAWSTQVRRARAFSRVRWAAGEQVPVTTLDALIAAHGEPAFVKIDVEGYELEALRGLSRPLRALSLEYVPATIGVALGCIERLETLGRYTYNWSVGEMQRLEGAAWVEADEMAARLSTLDVDATPGDIYARLASA